MPLLRLLAPATLRAAPLFARDAVPGEEARKAAGADRKPVHLKNLAQLTDKALQVADFEDDEERVNLTPDGSYFKRFAVPRSISC